MNVNQLLTAVLIKKLRQGRKRKREDSSSESDRHEGGGLRALNDEHRIDRRIVKRPRKLPLPVERDIREKLGGVPGQAWPGEACRRSSKELEQKLRRETSPTLSGGEEERQGESNRARKARLKKKKGGGAAAPGTR